MIKNIHIVFSVVLYSSALAVSFSVYAQEEQEFSTEFISGHFNHGDVVKALNQGINARQVYSVQINGIPSGDYFFSRKDGHIVFTDKFFQDVLAPRLNEALKNQLHNDMFLDPTTKRYGLTEDNERSLLSVWFKDNDLLHMTQNDDEPLAASINSLTINYNTSANYYQDRDSHNTETSLPLNSHVRLALYDFPVDVDLSTSDLIRKGVTVDNLSVSHLLPAIQSEISAGQTFTHSRYTQGFSFYGVKLASVDDLHSRHDRYYTPNITGYARTNATVEVYQGTRMLFTKTVAAGQFVIDEIQGLSNQTLRVVVNESDGTKNTFLYENTVVPGLLTPGNYSYELNSGKYRYNDHHAEDAFASVEYSYGFNALTATIDTLISSDYKGVTLGTALPLQTLGALGVSVSGSRFKYSAGDYQGQSYSLNYAKYLSNGFNLQLAGYRYSTRRYLSFTDAMDLKHSGYSREGSLKNRFTTTLTMKEPVFNNQLSLNIMRSNYWSTMPATTTYSLSYGGYVRQVGYTISVAKSLTQHFESDTSIALSISIPFGSNGRSVFTRYSANRYSNNIETGLNSYSGDDAWTLAASRDFKTDNTSLSGAWNQGSSRYNSQVSAGVSTHTAYASGSVSGTVAYAEKHLILSNSQSQTMALVNVSGAESASVNGVNTQHDGFALVPLNDNFDGQDITVDADSLKNSVQLSENQIHVRPRRGQLSRARFSAKKIKFIRAALFDAQRRRLAFGTTLTLRDTGETVITGHEGTVLIQKALTTGAAQQSIVLEEDESHCRFVIPFSVLKDATADFIEAGELVCQRN